VHKILKCKSGASLLFVLGIMMLLLALGTSAIAAATANIGYNLRQREQNNIRVLTNSVHRSILHSLNVDLADPPLATDDERENTLAYQILHMIIYANNREEGDAVRGGIEELTLDVTLNGFPIYEGTVELAEVIVTFSEQNFSISTWARPYIPAIPVLVGDDVVDTIPAVQRVPKTVTVNAELVVTVVVRAGGAGLGVERYVSTRAVFEYWGGILSDDPGGIYLNTADQNLPDEMDLQIQEFGTWSMISYEVIT